MKATTVLAVAIGAMVIGTGILVAYGPNSPILGASSSGSTSSSNFTSSSVGTGDQGTTMCTSQTSSVGAVGPCAFNGSFFQAPQHDLFQSQGLWWTFYSDGSDLIFRTSSTGAVWSKPAVAREGPGVFAVWEQNGTLYYVGSALVENHTTSHFSYRYGALEKNGTVSWGGAEVSVQTTFPLSSYFNAIAVDTSGNVWAAGTVANSTTSLEVYRNSGLGSNWTMVKAVGGGLESSIGTLVPLRTGMALIYGGFPDSCCASSPVRITTTTDGGATWSSPVSPPSQDYYMSYASAVGIGDTVYFVAPTLSEGLLFWNFTIGSNETSPETVLAPTPVADSLSESGGVLVAAYSYNTSVYVRESGDRSHWTNASLVSRDGTYASLMTSTFSGDYGLLWNGAVWRGSEEIGNYARFYTIAQSALSELTR